MTNEEQMLHQKTCKACEGGVPPLGPLEIKAFLTHTPAWTTTAEGTAISRTFVLKDFQAALKSLNAIGAIAESEGHHPDLLLHGWNKLTVTLQTHAIGGLSENDFIVAAKIDRLSFDSK